jgi:hypothetical protein
VQFFQWIDDLEMWYPQILLFPYDRSESFLYHSFKRWVPPPPNPPLVIDEKKEETTTRHVHNLPLCNYNHQNTFVLPSQESAINTNYVSTMCEAGHRLWETPEYALQQRTILTFIIGQPLTTSIDDTFCP